MFFFYLNILEIIIFVYLIEIQKVTTDEKNQPTNTKEASVFRKKIQTYKQKIQGYVSLILKYIYKT